MSIAVELPEIGESVTEGTISRWLVQQGDRVEIDCDAKGEATVSGAQSTPTLRSERTSSPRPRPGTTSANPFAKSTRSVLSKLC